MKIAVICPGYPPVIGGVEMLVQETAEALAADGVVVEVWTQSTAVAVATSERRAGVVIRRFPASHSRRFPISIGLARHVRRYAGEFDLLHVHNYHAMPAATTLLVDEHVPVVFSAHFHGRGHSRLARLLHVPYEPIGSRILKRADRLIAASHAERASLVAHFPSVSHKIVVVQNGVDEAGIRAADPWPDQPPTVLLLGRLETYKRVERALAAFGAVDDDAQMIIVGDGLERRRLAHQAERYGDRVRLLGELARVDVRRWLRTARVVINMSSDEAFGVVGLEAACAGAMAIVSDIPAHREIQHMSGDDRIVLVDPADPRQLERELAAAMAKPNVGTRPTRSWGEVAHEYREHYDALVGQRPARADLRNPG